MPTISVAVEAPSKPRPRVATADIFPIEGDITCRACGAAEKVPLAHPALLCSACLEDLSATTRRLAEAYAGAMEAFFEASATLAEAARGDEWFAKTEAARGDMSISPEAFARAWEKARAAGGKKADLVMLRDAMDAAALALREAEQKFLRAAPELAAARAARGEPIDVG